MRRIMAATDGSTGGNRAVDAAARLAKGTGAELLLFTVGGNLSGAELRRLATVEGNASEELKAAADQVLKLAAKRATRIGVRPAKLECGWGDPAEIIIGTLRRAKVDLLVVGRRGRGRLEGLLLGSVSQKVTSLAPCAVMVVP